MSLKLLIALGFLDGFLPPPCVRFQTPCSKCEKKCTILLLSVLAPLLFKENSGKETIKQIIIFGFKH